MNEITIEKLINLIQTYNPDAVEDVKRAYDLADYLHKDQIRQSGEPYVSHPLNVAYILAEMHADCDTLCAGLLHDTLEDTEITKEEIIKMFGPTVANLVDGVTKLAKMNFSSKKEQNLANTRKIITSILEDVRIIIIKLADRLHNMRTLEYKSPKKQEENSQETLDIFVPIAYHIGAYKIKSELEDISLKYLKPDIYKSLEIQKKIIEEDSQECLSEIENEISTKLTSLNIPNEIKVRTKNIYGIYKKLEKGYKLHEIYDLLAVKIIVGDIKDCYIALGIIHNIYSSVPGRIKDYIGNPKTNMYQSLHTTVFGPHGRLIQIQIRTNDMDKTALYGLTALWDINKGQARYIMQESMNESQFLKYLNQINTTSNDNQDFVEQVKTDLLTNNIYVYTKTGMIIELPNDATILDYAYKTDPENAHNMVDAFVNDEPVPFHYKLRNKDRVKIITSELSKGPTKEWEKTASSAYVKKLINGQIKFQK